MNFVCFFEIFSQHQTSTTLLGIVRENRPTPALPRSPVDFPTPTPKPRAEGSSRQARQVLLPLPKSRRKHWIFAGFLFACVAWLCGSRWFKVRLFAPGLTRSQPLPSPPAPKTHPVSPFLVQTGCVFLFFAVFWLQNFFPGFCASCRIAFTN